MDKEIEFSADGLEAEQAEALARVNAGIKRLAGRKRTQIEVKNHLANSKLAWKLTTLQEAILYRVVALVRGTALTWNAGNFLTSMLAARALIETVVLSEDFRAKLNALVEAKELNRISQLLNHQTFATRDEEWLRDHPESKAVSILTLINKFDKDVLPGARAHYDSLSERCHPNSAGHYQMFSTLDRSTATVTYSDAKKLKAERAAIMPGVMLILLFEKTMDELDQATLDLAELQHRVDPVPDGST